MATVLAGPLAPAVDAGRYDRVFYSSMAIALAVTVFSGFGPTYYFGALSGRTAGDGQRRPDDAARAHPRRAIHELGAVVHRADGARGAASGGGSPAARHRRQRARGSDDRRRHADRAAGGGARGVAGGTDPLAFLTIPLTDMVLFGGFVTAALRLRRNREAHKRLMLLAYVSIIVAAVARCRAS